MTKLEEKLIELGYFEERTTHPNSNRFLKYHEDYLLIITIDNNKIYGKIPALMIDFTSQQDIDNLQQAFNILQQDLEVLREYA